MMEKTKTTAEIVPVPVDFTGALPSGETVGASSTVTATNSLGADVTGTLLSGKTNTTTTLTITVLASLVGIFTITFTVNTSPSGFKIIEYMQLTVLT